MSRKAWQLHREKVVDEWMDWDRAPQNVGERPWGWWVWDAPAALRWPYRDASWGHQDQTTVLRRLKLLGPDEEVFLEAEHVERARIHRCRCRACQPVATTVEA